MKRLRHLLFGFVLAVSLITALFASRQAVYSAPLDVHVNQHGYYPDAPKRATIVNSASSPVSWTLRNSGGTAVASGSTIVYGNDSASGDYVHIADFSAYNTAGNGYTLIVDGVTSHPFNISDALYNSLKYDALAYFYHARSGIAIQMPYAGQSQWTRPAGHNPDIAACWPGTGCSYSLDVTKGWYDAGDHGKYVVNGGISAWTMMNQYERSLYLGNASYAFNDGSLNIPENSNGVPDILDEARWQMEFMLSMQVPAGQSQAGMAHHKIHDESWTGLPTAPHEDNQTRYLRPPSTAATLNLAATAAQCARIWNSIDTTFANQCLSAAETAWDAALANPAIYAPNHSTGGGPYNDNDVTDEFYWAAAELFITTGATEYENYLTSSSHYLSVPSSLSGGDNGLSGVMTWASTQALGSISLAIVPNGLSSSAISSVRSNINQAADSFINILNNQGYLTPFTQGPNGYPWGSNSFVLNNMVIMGLAYDFTGSSQYLYGMTEGMDYIMGRNPMDQSYVTGYGENPLLHPHHRFFADQVNASYPPPPPGFVSGGPNSGLEDPYAQSIGLPGCAPQKCFVDHIDSWSTNEVTINWNAPFAWVVSYLDEAFNSGVIVPPTPTPTVPPGSTPTNTPIPPTPTTVPPTNTPVPGGPCAVDYNVVNQWGNGFQVDVTITNNDSSPIAGWTLTWTHASGQQVTSAWNATVSQTGNNASASNPASHWNGTIGANGGTVAFGFQGTHTGSVVIPTDFAVNGTACNGGGPIPTATSAPPTATSVPPTATSVPPTATSAPPTATSLPPTATSVPPTATSVPPTATSVPPTATSVPPTATPGSGAPCSIDYVVVNQWSSGFNADVTITNTGSNTINGWSVTFTFPGNQSIVNLWNGSYTQNGASVAVTDAGYNGSIPAGGNVSFGFQASYSGSNASPSSFILNGVACN